MSDVFVVAAVRTAVGTFGLVHELRRLKGRYGLVTLCIGGGQGIAAVFERV